MPIKCQRVGCDAEAEGLTVFELFPSMSVQTLHGFYSALAFLPSCVSLCQEHGAKITLEESVGGAESLHKISLNVQDKTSLFPDYTQTRRRFVSFESDEYDAILAFRANATREGAN